MMEPMTAEELRSIREVVESGDVDWPDVAERLIAEVDRLRSRLATVERERDVLRTTATTFLARFDELMPHVIGFITTACLRVGINDWGYGDWTNELAAFRAALAASVEPERDAVSLDRYQELLWAVARKYPDESRHETALRYIRNAEMPQNNPPATTTVPPAKEEE